jgi:sugar-specific transcriptional regulator TrmB
MNLTQIFQRLGFGKNASTIYKTLLDKGRPMLITHVAEAAKIDRPEVYRCLSPLIKQGFVVKTPVGKRCGYSVEDPRRVHSAFIRDTNSVNKFTADLLAKKVLALPAHITYFKGAEGVHAIFNDVIDRMPRGGTFYRYTSERNLAAVNRYLSPDYRVRRDKKKLERLVISNPVSGKAKRQRLERFIKFIPPEADLFDQNVIQLVYADSIAFINLNTEEGYVIRDPDLARFQTVIFKQFYSRMR